MLQINTQFYARITWISINKTANILKIKVIIKQNKKKKNGKREQHELMNWVRPFSNKLIAELWTQIL